MVQAVRYFDQAQQHYLEHEWRHTVESLRQSLAALVGKQPEDEDQDARVLQPELREVRKRAASERVGYGERYEPVRAALKFLCDLGAHPDVAETEKQHAYSAMLMVAGLLHADLGGRRTR